MKRFLTFLSAVLFVTVISFPAFAEKVMNADVVVVGAGGSGTAAAYAAAQAGAKSVIILEKQPGVGGTGNNAEGIFAADSRMQLENNVDLPTDQAFQMIMNYSHWRANARLVRAFVNKTADTVEWLQKAGVQFTHLTSNYPNGLRSWHIFNGRGATMIKTLQAKFPEMNVTLLKETPGEKLIMKDGKVAGVMAKDMDGETIRINAKAVIIGTGGFLNNKEMLKKYTRYPDVVPVGNIGKTGDGIRMMLEAGAATEGLEVVQSYRPGIPGEATDSHLAAPGRQPYMWVNTHGERFCDEMVIFQWPFAGNCLEREGGMVWAVFDSDTKDYMINHGIDNGVGVMVPTGTKLDRLEKDLVRGEKAGIVVKAATIEELAKKTGMNPTAFATTVKNYNRYSDIKHDEEFAKNPKYLKPVAKGPFYAIKSFPTALGTLGGAKVTKDLQVVDKNDNPIPGLYAIGNDAGGMYGDSYDLLMAGSTIGFAVNSGRIAAEHAVKYINGK